MAFYFDRSNPMTDKSIVLDLDETLVQALTCDEDDRIQLQQLEDLKIYDDPNNTDLNRRSHRLRMYDACAAPGTGEKFAAWVLERPHLREFLIYCFEYFKTVNVWTAGTKKYGEEIAQAISKSVHPFDHIFTRENCDLAPDGRTCYKPLEKMIEKYPDIGPIEKVFILDDRTVSFTPDPDNGVLIPPYQPSMTLNSLNRDDDNLLRFKYWLNLDVVKECPDIRTLDKSNIFKYSVQDYKSSSIFE